MFRYGAKLVHDTKLSVGLFGSFLMYMLQVAIAFAFLASVFSGTMILTVSFELLQAMPVFRLSRFHASGWC